MIKSNPDYDIVKITLILQYEISYFWNRPKEKFDHTVPNF